MSSSPSPPESEVSDLPGARRLVFLLPFLVAAIELLGRVQVESRVPGRDDYVRAAAFVRSDFRPGDQILAVPSWTDPLVREVLGDRITLPMAGAVDLDRFERVWVLSIRGRRAALAPDRRPDVEKRFGRVTVSMWRLGPSPVLYDLVEHEPEATVTIVRQGVARPCPLGVGQVRASGLGSGPAWPTRRHLCDPATPWLFVAPTVNEDLDLALRRCVWQHPAGDEPVTVTYEGIPLGERIVLDADLYSEHERMEEHPPVALRVRVDGREVGLLVHRDGEGRKRLVASTQVPGGPPKERGNVTIETMAHEPAFRTICWSAVVEGPERRELER